MNKDKCDFEPVCRRGDIYARSGERLGISYWPRDDDLRPYCEGKNDYTVCRIHSYLEDNPKLREQMREWSDGSVQTKAGLIPLAAGCFSIGTSDSTFLQTVGGGLVLLGLYSVLEGTLRRKGIRGTKEIITNLTRHDGTDDLYKAILEETEDTDIDAGSFWDREVESMNDGTSIIDDIEFMPEDIRARLLEETPIQVSKLSASHLLTNDFNLYKQRVVGTAVSYSFDPFLPEPLRDSMKEDDIANAHYVTGILLPEISRGKLRDGLGFILGSQYVPLAVGVMGKNDVTGDIQTGIVPTLVKNTGLAFGPAKEIFGDTERFDQMTDACMDEATRREATNIHRLMQDLTYSSVPRS